MAAAFRFPAYDSTNFINGRRFLNNPYGGSYVSEIDKYADYLLSLYPNKNPNSYSKAQILQWVSRFAANYYNYLENPTEYLGVDGGALWSIGWFASAPLFVIDDFELHGMTVNKVTVDADGAIVLRNTTTRHGLYTGMKMTITSTELTTGNGFPDVSTAYVQSVFRSGDPNIGYSVQLFTDSALQTPFYALAGKTPGDTVLTDTTMLVHVDETHRYKMKNGKLVWRGSLSGYGGTVAYEGTDTVFGLPRTVQYPRFKRGFTTSRGGNNNIASNMNPPAWLTGDMIGTNLTFEKAPQVVEQDSVGVTIDADIAQGYLPAGATYTVLPNQPNPYQNTILSSTQQFGGHRFGNTVTVSQISGNVITISDATAVSKLIVGNIVTGTIDGLVLEGNQTLFSRTGGSIFPEAEGSYWVSFPQTGVQNININYIIEGPGLYSSTYVTEIDYQGRRVKLNKPSIPGANQVNATYDFKVPGVELIQQLSSSYSIDEVSTPITNTPIFDSTALTTTFTVSLAATGIQVEDIVSGTNAPDNITVIDVDTLTALGVPIAQIITVTGAFTGAVSGNYVFRRGGRAGRYRINRSYPSITPSPAATCTITDPKYDLGFFPKLTCLTGGRTAEDTEVFVIGRGMTGGGLDGDDPDPVDGLFPNEYPGRFANTAPVAVYFTGIPSTYDARWATQANDLQWESAWETDLSLRDLTGNYDSSHNSQEKAWPRHIRPQSMTYSIEQPSRVLESSNLTRWTRDIGVVRWKFKLNYPPMTREDFIPFKNAIHAAHGQTKGFRLYIGDVAGFTQIQNTEAFLPPGNDTPLRDMLCYSNVSANAGETFMTIDGFRPRVDNAVNAGDVIKVTHRENNENFFELYTIINTGDSDEMGRVRIRLSHPLRGAVSSGAAHRLSPSHVWVSLMNDQQDFDISTAQLYGFSVEFATQSQRGKINYQNRGIV